MFSPSPLPSEKKRKDKSGNFPGSFPEYARKNSKNSRSPENKGNREFSEGTGMNGFSSHGVTLRPLLDRDMRTVRRFLLMPHVLPWFSPAESWIEEIEGRRGAYGFVHHFLVCADGRDIGFCQYYDYSLGGETWQGTVPVRGSYSIDYLIGEEAYLRRGYGRAVVMTLTEHIFARTDAERILVQPEKENLPSRNTLRSAGYLYDRENDLFYRLRP